MLQAEDDLLHRESTFANDTRGVEQHEAPHQAQDQMPIVSVFTVRLTDTGCQQVLQGPKAVLNPVTLFPCPYKPWPADGGLQTHHVELLLPGYTDHDECHGPIRRTGGPQPRIAHAGDLRALTPEPIAELLQVVALDLAPIGQVEGVGTLPFHEERPLVGHR